MKRFFFFDAGYGRLSRGWCIPVFLLACWVGTGRAGTVYWTADVNGNWSSPANWSGFAVPTAADDVVISRPSNPTVTLDPSANTLVYSLLLDDALIVRNINFGVTTTATLNGSLQLDKAWLGSGVFNGGTGGQIVVASGSYGGILNATINCPITVLDHGQLEMSGAWQNAAPVTGTNASFILGGTYASSVLDHFSGTGNTVTLSGTINNAGVTLAIDSRFQNWHLGYNSGVPSRVVGGTIEGPGVLELNSGAILDGVTLKANTRSPASTDVYVRNGLTLLGSEIEFQGNSSAVWMQGGSQTIGGSGSMLLGGALYAMPGNTITIGPGVTVHGNGGVTPNGGTFVNQGTIVGDGTIGLGADNGYVQNHGLVTTAPNGSLVVYVDSTRWINTGLLKVDGGTLILTGAFDQAALGPFQYKSGSVNMWGTLLNAGQTLALSANTGSWTINGTINGGRVTASDGVGLAATSSLPTGFVGASALTGSVVLDVSLTIPQWSTVTVKDGLLVNRVITLSGGDNPVTASKLDFSGSQTLAGSGEVVFNGSNNNILEPTNGSAIVIGEGIVVRTGTGGGVVGNTSPANSTTNRGTLSAQAPFRQLLVAGAFTNLGTVEAKNGGFVTIANPSALTNLAGTSLAGGRWKVYAASSIDLGNAVVTVNDADIVLSGADSHFDAINGLTSNTGSFTLGDGRGFSASSFSNGGTLHVGAGSQFSASGLNELRDGGIELHIAGPESFGSFAVAGAVTLDGALWITLDGGYVPRPGDVFPVLEAGARTGTFSSVSSSGPGYFTAGYRADGVTLSYVPEPGTGVVAFAVIAPLFRRRPNKG